MNNFSSTLSVLVAFIIIVLLGVLPVGAAENFKYGSGFYINLYGGGADLNGNIGGYSGEADCRPNDGVCYITNKTTGQKYSEGHVQRYICEGKVLNCDNTHAPGKVLKGPEVSTSQTIGSVECDRTVQLDVFDKPVGSGTLKGYMTWYSGTCPIAVVSTPTSTPSPTPTLSPTPTPTQQAYGGVLTPTPTPTPTPVKIVKAAAPKRVIQELPKTGAEGWLYLLLVLLGVYMLSFRRGLSGE